MTVTTTSQTEPLRVRLGLTRSGDWDRESLAIVVLGGLLLLLGLIMSLSASFVADAQSGDVFETFGDQVTFATVGVVLFFGVARTNHRVWRLASWPMIVVAILALVLVIIPGVGLERFGSTRWLSVGGIVVQPSELAKLATLLWLADVAARKRTLAKADGTLPVQHLLVPAMPLFAVEAVLLMLEPDFGTTILVALIVGLVLWYEGISLRLVTTFLLSGALLSGIAIATAGYRMDRIRGWLRAEEDPSDTGYQLLQSLYALGSGGWFGTGLGESRGKWNFIPNPETDFIFAIIGEELGLVGALVVVGLFASLAVVGMRIARRTDDRFGRVVAAALTGWVVGQAFINIGTVTGLLPITGVTLPLVSVGGSSLISTLVALGILASIARGHTSTELEARP